MTFPHSQEPGFNCWWPWAPTSFTKETLRTLCFKRIFPVYIGRQNPKKKHGRADPVSDLMMKVYFSINLRGKKTPNSKAKMDDMKLITVESPFECRAA